MHKRVNWCYTKSIIEMMDSKDFILTPAVAKALQLPADLVKFGLGDTSPSNLVRTFVSPTSCPDGRLDIIHGLGIRLAERLACSLSHGAREHIHVSVSYVAKEEQTQFNQIGVTFHRDTAQMIYWNVKNYRPEHFARTVTASAVLIPILEALRTKGYNVDQFMPAVMKGEQ